MDLCNEKDIRDLLVRHGFHFSKALGQNFLTASWVPERIAEESGAGEGTGVLEIGPGIGCLTRELSARAGRVVSVELDERLPSILSETLEDCRNVTIVPGDIMKLDIKAIAEEYFAGLSPAVCANLPYNITTPVISRLMETGLFGTITVMIQREVARRICAEPGTADYGAFTIYVNYYYEPEILFDVHPGCFTPQPKVTSSVVRMVKRETPAAQPEDEKLFFKVVKSAFLQRRKTLVNSLSSGLGNVPKDKIAAAITACGLAETVRGEALSIEQFASLSDEIGRGL